MPLKLLSRQDLQGIFTVVSRLFKAGGGGGNLSKKADRYLMARHFCRLQELPVADAHQNEIFDGFLRALKRNCNGLLQAQCEKEVGREGLYVMPKDSDEKR